ncbi:hypothetical protein GCM10028857_24120 [Salinarchaeum chitinilyticum]
MAYRLLLDENVEHEIGHRLEHYGHDVEHVDFVAALGKGAEDEALGRYSRHEDRVIVTYDDDFVLEISEDGYTAPLYLPDATVPTDHAADALHEIMTRYPQAELQGLIYVGSEWL